MGPMGDCSRSEDSDPLNGRVFQSECSGPETPPGLARLPTEPGRARTRSDGSLDRAQYTLYHNSSYYMRVCTCMSSYVPVYALFVQHILKTGFFSLGLLKLDIGICCTVHGKCTTPFINLKAMSHCEKQSMRWYFIYRYIPL